MTRLRYNSLNGTLGAALDDSETTITFDAALTYDAGTAVPTITYSDYIPISILDSDGNLSEIVYLTAYTEGDPDGTISRGQEGTAGVSHASGDPWLHGPTVLDVRVPSVLVAASGGGSVSTSTLTSLAFPSESYDTDGFHDNSTNNTRLTVPTVLDGLYMLVGQINLDFSGTGQRGALLVLNGNTSAPIATNGAPGGTSAVNVTWIGRLAAGDYVELALYQDSGSTRTVQTNSSFSMTRLDG